MSFKSTPYLKSFIKRFVDLALGAPLIFIISLLKSKYSINRENIHKILIIKLAAAGDAVLLVPVLKSIKTFNPNIKLHMLVSPVNEPIVKHIPYIDKLFNLKKKTLIHIVETILILRQEKYDVVFDLEQWARGSALISMLSAKINVGFDTKGQFRNAAFTKSVKKSYSKHEILSFYDVIRLYLDVKTDMSLDFFETEAGKVEVKKFINREKINKQIVIIHPGCGEDGFPREWPIANYRHLIDLIISKFSVLIILTSGPDEVEKTRQLFKSKSNNILDLGGKLSWEGTVSLISMSDLVVSGNTGVMHIAAAFGKNQIALHGPTNPVIWGPLNQNAIIVKSKCPLCPSLKLGFEYHRFDQSCMDTIPVDDVWKKTLKVLK